MRFRYIENVSNASHFSIYLNCIYNLATKDTVARAVRITKT
jgi:hypothetical protein